MSNVRVVDLVKRFEKVIAVNGVSLDIKSGEFVVLLGPFRAAVRQPPSRCIAGTRVS
jgi:ABC-type lipopolysaccharide export system ATPase subunit